MPHPIYGPPSHRLEVVHFRLALPLKRNGYLTSLAVKGESSTSRSSLWTISETWTPDEQEAGLQPTDALHHIALIAVQDRPSSQDAMFRQLTGEPYIQEVLPGF